MRLHNLKTEPHAVALQQFYAINIIACALFVKLFQKNSLMSDFDVFENFLTLLYQFVVIVEVDMARLPKWNRMKEIPAIYNILNLNYRVVLHLPSCTRERVSVGYKLELFFIILFIFGPDVEPRHQYLVILELYHADYAVIVICHHIILNETVHLVLCGIDGLLEDLIFLDWHNIVLFLVLFDLFRHLYCKNRAAVCKIQVIRWVRHMNNYIMN